MTRLSMSLCTIFSMGLGVSFMVSGCSRSETQSDQSQKLTLYTSVDDTFAKLVIDAFTEETGIEVQVLGDTEATKTTGLVTRVQAEMDQPRADVWWSSEPMGTILLARSEALEPNAMNGLVPEDWPTELRAYDWSWIGIAMRSRVLGYAHDRVEDPPTTLAQLTEPEYKARVGIARPQFGTTRIHMSILADQWGTEQLSAWLIAMKENKIRMYDGNARVVQAIAQGEIDIGLTDTDDVWAGQANGWKVDLVYEDQAHHEDWPSAGPALIPNTVGIIKGNKNPELAKKLAAYLVSPAVEEMLYQSTTHNTPIDPELRVQLMQSPDHDVLKIDELPDYINASNKVREAMDLCEQVLISP